MGSRPPSPIVPGKVQDDAFRRFVDSEVDYAMFLLDPEGHVASWNPGAERIKQYAAHEIVGRHFSIFYPPSDVADRKTVYALRIARDEGRYVEEGWRLRKDGTMFWASVVITSIKDEDGRLLGYAKVTRDLTERRHQQEAVRQSEERLRLMVESVKDYAIFMLDPEGRILTWNEGAQRLKGYKAEEIIGCPFTVFYREDDLARGHPQEELRIARREGRFEEEGWRLRKDGTMFWANVTITALRSADGTLRGFAKVTRDLTTRKRAEDASRRQAESVATLNRELEAFTSAVAHDLRAPLRAMTHLAGEAAERKSVQADPDALASVRAVQASALRMSDLIDGLLELSRSTNGELHVEPIDLTRLAHDVWHDLLRRDPSIRAKLEVHAGLTAMADARLVRALLDNMLNNAAKFTSRAASPVVQVGRGAPGGVPAYFVRDNGVGFDSTRARGLFEPFQRLPTAAEFGGIGIGLATVKRIVSRHGGRIWAESKEGDGATFWFTLG